MMAISQVNFFKYHIVQCVGRKLAEDGRNLDEKEDGNDKRASNQRIR